MGCVFFDCIGFCILCLYWVVNPLVMGCVGLWVKQWRNRSNWWLRPREILIRASTHKTNATSLHSTLITHCTVYSAHCTVHKALFTANITPATITYTLNLEKALWLTAHTHTTHYTGWQLIVLGACNNFSCLETLSREKSFR